LIIDSTSSNGSYYFSFSLLAFLDVINGTNLKEIIIKSTEYDGHCWIRNIWASNEQMLKKTYSAKGYMIEMEKSLKRILHRRNSSVGDRYNLILSQYE